jgi:hypothetical protein
MHEQLSRAEKDELYQEAVSMLPHYGWPPWPPKEVPKLISEWWKEETTIPPEGFLRPHFRLVEFSGLPQGGRSTLEKELKEKLGPEMAREGWGVDFWDERLRSVPETAQSLSFFPMPGAIGIFFKDEGDWTAPFSIQHLNHYLWSKWIRDLSRTAKPSERKLVLGFRGPIDISVWFFTHAAHQEDPNFAIPEWYREEELIKWGQVLARNQPLISDLDAAILIGISQKEAKKRREQAGKDYPGWVTDSPIFPELSAWYEYFIKKVHPRVNELKRKKFAERMGLLVLNGEASIEENLEGIINFCRQVVGIKK